MEKPKFKIGEIEQLSLLGQRHLATQITQRIYPEILTMVNKLILPGDIKTPTSREKLISEFLKNWLTDKQMKGMSGWYVDMLDTFMTEVLLTAQKVGIERLLISRATTTNFEKFGDIRQKERRSLALVPVKKKPKISQVTLEEVGGDLASDTKSILLRDVKIESENSIVDVVDHVK